MKELPKEHREYIDGLIKDMWKEEDMQKQAGIEDMFLIRMIRLKNMGYETTKYTLHYENYMKVQDAIYRREEGEGNG